MNVKKSLPILLGMWPYIVIILMFFLTNEKSHYGIVLSVLLVMTAVVYISNIINACSWKMEDVHGAVLANMVIKLIHIPFYILVFVIGAMALLVMVVPVFVFISPAIAIMLAVIDFFLMLTSSAYGINALILAKRNGRISTKFMICNIILHLFFVLDVISAVVVFVKVRKSNESISLL